jgi:ABC-type phosphate/phosphonate transport system substrate-binding protein
MIAVLPMYDRPENAEAHDALWAAIRDALRSAGARAPDALDRRIGLAEAWEHPDLVLGQTCGLPFRTVMHDRVTLVATLDYALPDTPPGYYRSVLVARRGDTRSSPADFTGATLAYNSPDSHSGWAAPSAWAAAHGLRFGPRIATGAHRASARAVASGKADLAAIDAVTWRGIAAWEPEVAGALKVIGQTDASPGLPLIAARGADAEAIAGAVEAAAARLDAAHRATLGLAGVVRLPAAAYLAEPIPPKP